jgi:hypothetical protein
MSAAILVPVRRTPASPLHLGEATGRGYRTACGRTLQGEHLDLPMPRRPLTRRRVFAHWARCWKLEHVCTRCRRLAERP